MGKLYFFVAVVLCLAGCNVGENRLREALRLAGDNRGELEKVLEHYSHDKADSLKLKAATFLIENMPGHTSYIHRDVVKFREEYRNIMLDSLLSLNQKKQQLHKLSARHVLKAYIVDDTQIITSDFLIYNIDRSFEIWENEPYCQHLNFDEFCELILPYKCVELQALDKWKTELAQYYNRMYMMPLNDEFHYSVMHATKSLLSELKAVNNINLHFDYGGNTSYDTEMFANIKFGTCDDYSYTAVAIMRSKGIPACFEWMPQWAQGSGGHSWFSILNHSGAYMPSPWIWESLPGDAFFPDHKVPKIFRGTYATNHYFEEYQNNSLLKLPIFNKFQKDVTDLYLRTSDLEIPINAQKIKEKYAYLATFNNTVWNPIDLGVVKGSKALFENIAQGIAYVVLGYDGRELKPISTPFILESSGEIRYCIPQSVVSDSVKLIRKFPKSLKVATAENYIIGGQIQAANKPDFSDADTLYSIKNFEYPDLIPLNTTKQYRYWCYCQNTIDKLCTLAELQFYAPHLYEGPLQGTVIYSSEEAARGFEIGNAFDGDWLSSYNPPVSEGGWIGLDFGKPVEVEKVRIVPRSDDNGIHYGDNYELKYWSDGWVSLGEQVAKEKYLIFNGIPKGALLLLSNKTRGTEERIFTYENGRIRWW